MNSEIQQWVFPKMLIGLFVCDSGRIGQNFQNAVSLQKYILPQFAAYQQLKSENGLFARIAI